MGADHSWIAESIQRGQNLLSLSKVSAKSSVIVNSDLFGSPSVIKDFDFVDELLLTSHFGLL